MKEAQLYQKTTANQVRCGLCAHRCLINDGQRGICGVRENHAGRLGSLNYGRAIAANSDPIEKKPLYHFLPGSAAFSVAAAGCNFRCRFCQNWQESQITKGRDGRIIGEELSPETIVSLAQDSDCAAIAYTYTEPTVFFEYAAETAQIAKKAGLKNVFVTNGYQTPETIEKMTGAIDAANIDLKSFRDDYYREVCGARLEPVLAAIKLMHQAGIWIELTTLVVPEQNDSEEELTAIAEFIAGIDKNIPWHISRFHPDYEMTDAYPTPIETLEKAAAIGKQAGLNFVYLGNIPGHPLENTFCPSCQTKIIARIGYNTQSHLDGDACPQCHQKIPGIFNP